MQLASYAKVNLTLEVLRRRPDGYHDISSVIQTISLHDDIALEAAPALSLDCDAPDLTAEDNLAMKAAALLKEASGYAGGARIQVRKRIPMAAGLGGGSSNAATVLLGLGQLWKLDWAVERLQPLAERLGSDVSFFLLGGCALAEGRGERLTPLPSPPAAWLVLLEAPLKLPGKTGALYKSLQPSHFSDGSHTRMLVEAIQSGGPLLPEHLYNTFEQVAYHAFPSLAEYRDGFRAAGALHVRLAGSGPTLFSLVEDEQSGSDIATRLAHQGHRAHLVRTVAEGRA